MPSNKKKTVKQPDRGNEMKILLTKLNSLWDRCVVLE